MDLGQHLFVFGLNIEHEPYNYFGADTHGLGIILSLEQLMGLVDWVVNS